MTNFLRYMHFNHNKNSFKPLLQYTNDNVFCIWNAETNRSYVLGHDEKPGKMLWPWFRVILSLDTLAFPNNSKGAIETLYNALMLKVEKGTRE